MSDLIESWKVNKCVVNVRRDDYGMVALDGPYTGEPTVVDQGVYRTMELLIGRIEDRDIEIEVIRRELEIQKDIRELRK